MDVREAFNTLKGWYRAVSKTSTKPCYHTLEQQTTDREEFYRKVETPGDSIPINVDPFPIKDDVPSDSNIRDRV